MQGTIKKVVHDRGFGFIQAQDGKEIFFHRSSLQQLDFDTLKEGESVEFEVERGIRGREPSICELVGLELQLRLSWTTRTDVCPIAAMLGPRRSSIAKL